MLPKQWMINMAYAVIKEPFADWIREQVDDRNLKVTKEKDLNIAMDPAIYTAFQKSTAVSRKCPFSFSLALSSYSSSIHRL